MWKTRREAATNLNHFRFAAWRSEISRRSRVVRHQETMRLHRKRKWIEKKKDDCTRHTICRWMRSFWENEERQREVSEVVEEEEVEEKEEGKRTALQEAQRLEVVMEKINLEIKKEDDKTIRDKLVTIYGGLDLDEDELTFQSLGPDFTLLETVDVDQAKEDVSRGKGGTATFS